jgi:hypothetical protein
MAGPGESAAAQRFSQNPFRVLGLSPAATRAEVERAAQRLLAELELGLAAAKTYATALGPRPRDAGAVRAAAAELRDPAKRAWHELWALAPVRDAAAPAADRPAAPLPPALRALGWRR